MAALLNAVPGSLRKALAKPCSPLCCCAPCPLFPVCFAHPSLPSLPSFLVSFYHCSLFYFQPSALFLKENSWAAGVKEKIFFLTTLQIPLLMKTDATIAN